MVRRTAESTEVASGLFLIADVSRYTSFLADSELEHAQEILESLFNAILKKIRPPFQVSNFQGDAIFSFCPSSSLANGDVVLNAMESIYIGFSNALEQMRVNTTCECRACSNMKDLDLKMILHEGRYLSRVLQDRRELTGSDVILSHRLLKNSVSDLLGISGGYALLTRSAVEALDLEEAALRMRSLEESYEHLGTVTCYVYNLLQALELDRSKRRVLVSESESELSFEIELPLPLEVAWEFLQRPRIKAVLQGALEVQVLSRPSGRTGVGTVYHCAHGVQSSRQTIVDWRPYEYFTVKDVSGFGLLKPSVLSSYQFSPIDESRTLVTFRMGRPRQGGPLRGAMVGLMWATVIRGQLANRMSPALREQILDEIRSDQAAGRLWSEGESTHEAG
jgi:hypothetical protein